MRLSFIDHLVKYIVSWTTSNPYFSFCIEKNREADARKLGRENEKKVFSCSSFRAPAFAILFRGSRKKKLERKIGTARSLLSKWLYLYGNIGIANLSRTLSLAEHLTTPERLCVLQ